MSAGEAYLDERKYSVAVALFENGWKLTHDPDFIAKIIHAYALWEDTGLMNQWYYRYAGILREQKRPIPPLVYCKGYIENDDDLEGFYTIAKAMSEKPAKLSNNLRKLFVSA